MTYKKQYPLFLTKNNTYVLIGENFCENCKEVLESHFFILSDTSKKRSVSKVLCHSCVSNYQRLYSVISETKIGFIKDKPNKTDKPIFLVIPNLKDSRNNETVFSACTLESEKVVDKAFRSREFPSLEGSTVGKSIEQMDKEETIRLEQVEKKLLEVSK